MEIKIGDKVRTKVWDEMPEAYRVSEHGYARSRGKMCGKVCTVMDILQSSVLGQVYILRNEEGGYESSYFFTEDCFEKYDDTIMYKTDIYRSEDKVFCIIYRVTANNDCKQIASGYGFISESTDESYAGAVSWAAKKAYQKLAGIKNY